MIELKETPISVAPMGDILIYVKREDLCAPPGAPPFSKIRGVVKHLEKIKNSGITTVGYTETSISMAGWAVAWAGKKLGLRVVIFNPIYKNPLPELEYHRYQWRINGAKLVDIKAGMAKVNYNISKRMLGQIYGNSAVMLPLGLPFPETIVETAKEFIRTNKSSNFEDGYKTVVVNVGSGTICSGLYKGMKSGSKLFGIMGRTGLMSKKLEKIERGTGFIFDRNLNHPDLFLVDQGFKYTDSVEIKTSFPCNKYYDAKAWKWLEENYKTLEQPILFWNIGANTPSGVSL